MPLPLVPIMIGASLVAGAGANLYSQYKQRELYRYQKQAYERQYEDWKRNVPGRTIRYPELSYPGHIRALDTGISQSYASSIGSGASLGSTLGYGAVSYGRRARFSLYAQSVGRTSRYL